MGLVLECECDDPPSNTQVLSTDTDRILSRVPITFQTMCGELVTFQHLIWPRGDPVPNHPLGYVAIFHAVEPMGSARFGSIAGIPTAVSILLLYILMIYITRRCLHINTA